MSRNPENIQSQNNHLPKIITGATVICPASGLEKPQDVLIEDGKITAVDNPGAIKRDNAEEISANNLILTPGLFDIHVHLREPGFEWKETIETGVNAAVAGGFTTVCCMPNTEPAIDTASTVEFIKRKTALVNKANVLPIGAITVGRHGKALSPMEELVEAGCIAFSDDGLPVENSQMMRKALEYSRMLGTVLAVHEEDMSLSDGFSMNESPLSFKLGLKGMPEASENVMIARDIELARLTKGRVHFCHVSSARGVQLIERAKEDGISVTAEVSPHHLDLTEEEVIGFDTKAKMSMPLRTRKDIDALILGLEKGIIDCIATDHAPHEADSKNVEFDKASFGIIGFQTALPIIFEKIRNKELSLKRVIEALTVSPAKCFNIKTPKIAVGEIANLTLIDPNLRQTITEELIVSKSKNTPYLGREMQGFAVMTFFNGQMVFQYLGKK